MSCGYWRLCWGGLMLVIHQLKHRSDAPDKQAARYLGHSFASVYHVLVAYWIWYILDSCLLNRIKFVPVAEWIDMDDTTTGSTSSTLNLVFFSNISSTLESDAELRQARRSQWHGDRWDDFDKAADHDLIYRRFKIKCENGRKRVASWVCAGYYVVTAKDIWLFITIDCSSSSFL